MDKLSIKDVNISKANCNVHYAASNFNTIGNGLLARFTLVSVNMSANENAAMVDRGSVDISRIECYILP